MLCFALSAACAAAPRDAILAYPPRTSPTKIDADRAGKRGPIVLERFYDTRVEKRVVGRVRSGWGIPMAPVKVQENVHMVVTEAARAELARAGFEVIDDGDQTDREIPIITGTLLELSCDAYATHTGFVRLKMTLTRQTSDGAQTFTKEYEADGEASGTWTLTSEGYAESMSLALQRALRSFTKDLPKILKKWRRQDERGE